MQQQLTIAVDFDGTIVEHKYPKIGKELPFAVHSISELNSGKGERSNEFKPKTQNFRRGTLGLDYVQ